MIGHTKGARLGRCVDANERTVAITVDPRIFHVEVTVTPICDPGVHGGQTVPGPVNTTVDVSPAHTYPKSERGRKWINIYVMRRGGDSSVTYPGRAPGPLSSSHSALDVGAAVHH